jgi:hypothetical protein
MMPEGAHRLPGRELDILTTRRRYWSEIDLAMDRTRHPAITAAATIPARPTRRKGQDRPHLLATSQSDHKGGLAARPGSSEAVHEASDR